LVCSLVEMAGQRERSFITGFLEGEATLGISEQNGGQSFSCQMTLNQRDDAQDTMEWLLATTCLGRLRRIAARSTSKPQISWRVDSQEHCLELLALIEPCGFHGRRAAELELWSQAARAWIDTSGERRRTTMRRLMTRLAVARRFGGGAPAAAAFAGRDQLLGYISGFLAAEGCFTFSDARPRFAVHLRQDDRPLLDLLATTTGLGNVTAHGANPPLNPTATWTVTSRSNLAELIDLLRQGGLSGRKLREMEVWAAAVHELNQAPVPRREVLKDARVRLARVRAYAPPEREDLLRLPQRNLSAESLAALTAWSRETTGKLACTSYMRWRRGHRNAPGRNTIVGQFGSWHAALEAAGLADRIARAPRPIGGEAGRAARRVQQRERVIAAVRVFESEHGHRPRALEFFRWRYAHAVDAPTQGTVYNLFPGGWAEVLALV
jgi:hypothetical protein